MKFCPHCGKELPVQTEFFCPYCGKQLSDNKKNPSANMLSESFKKNPYFYISGILCFFSIITLFLKWANGSEDNTLFYLFKQSIQMIEWRSQYSMPVSAVFFLYFYSIIILSTGIFYGIVIFQLFSVIGEKYAYKKRTVLGTVRKVSMYAIIVFILQIFIGLLINGGNLSIIFSYSLGAYAYLIFAIVNRIIAQKGILQPIE